MALSTREVLMIIRAKDLASSELARIGTAFSVLDQQAASAARSHIAQGSALMGVGAAMGVAGGAALAFYVGSAKAAMEYNRESALTLTQTDQLGLSLQDVADIGRRVAREIPAPFKEMQAALYEIFSGMTVTAAEAEKILTSSAKAAVAGQVEIKQATSATIGIMNGFHKTVEDLDHILAVQFETVRKGIITYDEYSSVIGRIIPSAVKAGQSFEDMGGALAFLTRNKMSAAMSATSLARAYDLLSNPKFVNAMEKFGVTVTDTAGNFRPLVDVAGDLRKRFIALGYTKEEIAAKLQSLTKGAGGTIQAMRALNLMVQDSEGQFRILTNEVRNADDAFEEAYRIMKDTPAAQIQALVNSWQLFRDVVGNAVLPIFGALAKAIKTVLDWFLDLDPALQDTIARVGFLIAGFVTLTGILTALGGAILIVKGTFALLHGSILPILATVTGFAALAAAIIYVASQTEFFQDAIQALSDFFRNSLWPRIRELKEAFDEDGVGGLIRRAGQMWERDRPILMDVIQKTGTALWEWVKEAAPKVLAELNKFAGNVGEWFSDTFLPFLERTIAPMGKALWGWIKENTGPALGALVDYAAQLGNWIIDVGLPALIDAIRPWAEALWKWIGPAIQTVLAELASYARAIGNWIEENAQAIYEKFYAWEDAFFDWLGPVTTKTLNALGDWLAKITTWIGNNGPAIVYAITSILVRIAEYIVTDLIPATLDAMYKWGQALTTAIPKLLIGIPAAIGLALDKPFRDAVHGVSEFEGQTKISMDSIKQMMMQTADEVATDLSILQAGGMNVAEAFKEIARQSPQFARAVIEAMKAAGDDTKIYENALRTANDEQRKVGDTAKEAFRKAKDGAAEYRTELDMLMGKITGVQDATARFDLSLASLNAVVARNAESTEDAVVKNARLQLEFSNVFKTTGDVIQKVKEHGLATDEDRAAIDKAIASLEDMRSKHPNQVAGLQTLIDKMKDLTTNTNATATKGLEDWQRFRDGSKTTFEGTNADLTSITGAMKTELVRLFKETGNDSYNRMREALEKLPPRTGEISQDTYNAVENVLKHMPGYTEGAGRDSTAAWLRKLAEGTGGTDATTAGWARAMLAILNPLLVGVGANPIEGDYARQLENANGNIVEWSRGGVENHIAQIAQPGTMRVWAEPETGGEAYIPLAKAKRSRSIRILKEVADRFGMTLAEFHEGGEWPGVPDFGAFGNMIGTRGGKDPVAFTREAVVAWDEERKRKLAEEAAQGVGGGSLSGGGWQAITNYLDSKGVPYTITSTTGGQHAPGSYHYAGKAVDLVSDNMMQIFNTLTQVGGSLAELFYDPAGWSIKNGQRVEWIAGGHNDHVHGAVMDAGGILQRGLNMIMNGTGKPEAVFNWDQFQAIEWLMGHAEKVAEAAQAAPAPEAVNGAATALSGQNLMAVGGKPGVAPSLGMMVETAQHTAGILGSNTSGFNKFSALTGGIASIAHGIQANRELTPSPFEYGNPDGIGAGGAGGATQTSQGPLFHEGAISMQITGNNPEQIAKLVEAKIRELIANLRMK